MKVKEAMSFIVFIVSVFIYDALPIISAVFLFLSLLNLYKMATKSEERRSR